MTPPAAVPQLEDEDEEDADGMLGDYRDTHGDYQDDIRRADASSNPPGTRPAGPRWRRRRPCPRHTLTGPLLPRRLAILNKAPEELPTPPLTPPPPAAAASAAAYQAHQPELPRLRVPPKGSPHALPASCRPPLMGKGGGADASPSRLPGSAQAAEAFAKRVEQRQGALLEQIETRQQRRVQRYSG